MVDNRHGAWGSWRLYALWRRGVTRFSAGPAHLAGRNPRACGSRLFTVLVWRWLRAFFIAHFTPAGGVLFLLSFLFAAFVMEAGRWRPAHLLPLAVLLLFLVNMAVGWIWLPRVSFSRRVPASVMAGRLLPVDYALCNAGRLPLFDVALEALPLPGGMAFAGATPRVGALAPGREARVRAELIAARRGRYVLPAPRVDSAFPLQLWRWGHLGHGERKLTVFPSFVPLQHVDMSFGARYQPGGVAMTSHVGGAMEFLSCREYRHGDDPRRLHPRSWARLGVPVVREFREEYLCRTALVLDTHLPGGVARLWRRRGADERFEAAVSLAAALADYLARGEYIVELFAAGRTVYRFEAGRSLAYLEDILDVLSCLDATPNEPFDALAPLIASEKRQMSSAIFILLGWNPVREQLIGTLSDAGVAVKAVLLGDRRSPARDGVPAFVQRVDWQDVRDGRCVEL